MRFKEENGVLEIYLEGRIDSQNAAEVEDEIMKAMDSHPSMDVLVDATDLAYISSAGLRALIKMRKRIGKPLRIREVSPEIYEIFETTGFTELFQVERKMRRVSVEGCEVLGEGFYGTVYRLDPETIIKVYNSPFALDLIQNEKKMARAAFISGIPTAISYDIVRVDDHYGAVFELLDCRSFNDIIIDEPERAEELLQQYVAFLKQIHDTVMKPGTAPSAKQRFLNYVDVIRESLPDDIYHKLKKILETIPESDHVIHGDYHMKNVMMQNGEPMLIDMDNISLGHPIFDLQALYVTYKAFEEDDPGNSEAFLGMSSELTDFIWKRIKELYFETTDPEVLEKKEEQIRVVAGVRFMYLLVVSGMKDTELGKLRIKHTVEHFRELLDKLETLV
ncbi:MAG: anti-sigma factor antagonist [Eubacterium sp.]|nr:anti-sigma factor antagonist [Eubacterium sp.]